MRLRGVDRHDGTISAHEACYHGEMDRERMTGERVGGRERGVSVEIEA